MSTGTGLYGACRSTQCCLAVWSRCAESSTRLGGFRALKKTTEAPYTTKVNYRGRTTREEQPAHADPPRPGGAGFFVAGGETRPGRRPPARFAFRKWLVPNALVYIKHLQVRPVFPLFLLYNINPTIMVLIRDKRKILLVLLYLQCII